MALMAIFRFALLVTGAVLLTGCGGSSGTVTGSLFGSSNAAPVALSAPVVDPTARAVQVGATSARASRCGFYFDPGKLKQRFLQSEATLGATPEQMQKIEKEYDYIRAAVAASTAKQPDYCTDTQAATIKADLNRHMAGDFTPAPKKAEEGGGFFGGPVPSNAPKPFQGTFDDITGKVQ